MGAIIDPPMGEPEDLSDQALDVEEIPGPSAAEMMALQVEAMRQRELEGQQRQALKFGARPGSWADHDQILAKHTAPTPGNSSYRWVFADGANTIELYNIPFDMADAMSKLLDDFYVKFTRYQQVQTWSEA